MRMPIGGEQSPVDADSERATRVPVAVAVAQTLFFVNAAIWVGFGVWTLVRVAAGNAAYPITMGIIAVMMAGNAALMALVGSGLGRQSRRFYWLGLALLGVNVVLTITDQVGAFDLATLLLDLALLALLLATRRLYASGGRKRMPS